MQLSGCCGYIEIALFLEGNQPDYESVLELIKFGSRIWLFNKLKEFTSSNYEWYVNPMECMKGFAGIRVGMIFSSICLIKVYVCLYCMRVGWNLQGSFISVQGLGTPYYIFYSSLIKIYAS